MSKQDQIFEKATAISSKGHLARIVYQKPTETAPSERIVEMYSLVHSQAGALLIRCWQVEPEDDWRTFRLDRILNIYDTRKKFKPKYESTLADGVVSPYKRGKGGGGTATATKKKAASRTGLYADYCELVTLAVMDGKLSLKERWFARKLKKNLTIGQIRSAHALIYADLIAEVTMDGEIDDNEVQALRVRRKLLKKLGWSP
ncbi:WYL domain-containing protein [Poriferisphaera sp. WC338]|uniref:WYL domain-containing protein n=1 Tax=Poriferisphaera sp. WC338 TaxID=3425129 RepID=UPI003D818F6D